jgi:hypothetical protein
MSGRRIGGGELRAELAPDRDEPRLVVRDDDGIVRVLHVRHDRVDQVRAALDDVAPDNSCVLEITHADGGVETWGRFTAPHHAAAVALVLLVTERPVGHAVVRAVVERPVGAQDLGRGSERLGEELLTITTPAAPTWWERQPL